MLVFSRIRWEVSKNYLCQQFLKVFWYLGIQTKVFRLLSHCGMYKEQDNSCCEGLRFPSKLRFDKYLDPDIDKTKIFNFLSKLSGNKSLKEPQVNSLYTQWLWILINSYSPQYWISYSNHSFDLYSKSNDWFLHKMQHSDKMG